MRVRAIFEYENDPSREPFVFERDLSPTIDPVSGNSYFPYQPSQMIKVYTTEQTLNKPTMELDARMIFRNGATFTVQGNQITPNATTQYNRYFGFEVQDGTLIFNNFSSINLGSGDNKGFIRAIGPQSTIIINGNNSLAISANIELLDGAKLIIDGTNVEFLNQSNIIVSNGSEIIINNNSITKLETGTTLTLNKAEFTIDDAKVISSNSSIDIIGAQSELSIQNNSEVFLSGTTEMNVSNNAKITLNLNSDLRIWHDSTVNLENNAKILVNNNSQLLLNNGTLSLKLRSKVVFNNSYFKTYEHSKIIGHTSGLWTKLEPETIGNGLPNIRGGSAFRWSADVPGDRIELHSSIIRLSEDTHISSGSNVKWDGIFMYDSKYKDFVENEESDYNVLRAEISNIRFIYLDNSFLDFNKAHVYEIYQLFAHNESELYMHNSKYYNNTEGINVTDNGKIYLWNTNIYNNMYGLLLEHSPDIANRIYSTKIYDNQEFGLQLIQSYVLMNGVVINDNLYGYIDFSSNFNIVKDTAIFNNSFVETAFRRAYYPYFARDNFSSPRPIIGNENSTNNSYLMIALGVSQQVVYTNWAIIDTSDLSRFYPDGTAYNFNDPHYRRGQELFEYAIYRIDTNNFYEAQGFLKDVIELYPDTDFANLALSYLPNLQVSTNTDYLEFLDYINSIDNNNLTSRIIQTRALTKMYNGDYVGAIEDFELILLQEEDTIEALFSELNMIYAQWKNEQNDGEITVLGDGSIMRRNDEKYLKNRDILLAKILNLLKEEDDSYTIPDIVKLDAINHPNPFNPETTIKLSLPETGNVRIDIYNIRGQRVKTLLNNHLNKGYHSILWNGTDASGRNVSSGVYFYRVITEAETITNRMLLMK